MFPTILLALAVGGEPLPQSTLPPLPPPLLLAPVVMQAEQLPPSPDGRKGDPWHVDSRLAELERRVAALEAEHARMGLRAPAAQPATMPVPAGYTATQTVQSSSSSYFATSGDAGACAGGSCGTSSGRAGLFGGRFRRGR